MVTQGFNQGDKILELAIQHLRAQPIPEFPDPTVELPLDLAQRDPIELKSNAINRKHVAISRRRSLSLAAAAFAAIAGGFAFWPWETSSQKAFAQLQEAVRSLNSLVFELKSYSGDQVTDNSKSRMPSRGTFEWIAAWPCTFLTRRVPSTRQWTIPSGLLRFSRL